MKKLKDIIFVPGNPPCICIRENLTTEEIGKFISALDDKLQSLNLLNELEDERIVSEYSQGKCWRMFEIKIEHCNATEDSVVYFMWQEGLYDPVPSYYDLICENYDWVRNEKSQAIYETVIEELENFIEKY